MTDATKIDLADVRVGDRIRTLKGDLIREGVVGRVSGTALITPNDYVVGNDGCNEIWLLERPIVEPKLVGAVVIAKINDALAPEPWVRWSTTSSVPWTRVSTGGHWDWAALKGPVIKTEGVDTANGSEMGNRVK